MSEVKGSIRSSTPGAAETTIYRPKTPEAPKKPKTKILECVQPITYRSNVDAKKHSKSEETIKDALSSAGVRRIKGESTKLQYPVPRKLTVSVVDGKTSRIIHKYVPTYLLMRVSPKAASVLEPRPWADRYKIYGPYDAAAVSNVLHVITLSNPIPITTDLLENLLTYEAALRLGITPSQPMLRPLLAAINAQVSDKPVTNEVLSFIERRLGFQEPVFKHTASVLCYQRFKGKVEDVKAFERMVAKRPQLQSAMVQIDCAHKKGREKRVLMKPEASEGKQGLGEKIAGRLEVVLGLKREESKQHREELLKILKGKTEAKAPEKTEKTN
ncbi:hypothetical protein SVAN01_00804 [Stagonosporopsis vannaccii]|nr:hypothetical protein SVAN01_00804 [Stagonosporopsis vannaccii]